MKDIEIRQISVPAKVEKRADGTLGSIYGYPIVYNKDSEDMGFIERIAPGAVKNALKRSDIRGLKNHDPSLIFARQGVNLTFKDDENGLRYEATPIDTKNFREIAEEVRIGLLTGQSFGFTIKKEEWEGLDTDKPIRTITEIEQIFDVGPVTYPAYPDTSVALRSLEKARAVTEKEEVLEIKVVLNEKEFTFAGSDCFEQATEKINSLRSGKSPKTSIPDNTSDDPSITQSDDSNLMDEMNKTINKYEG